MTKNHFRPIAICFAAILGVSFFSFVGVHPSASAMAGQKGTGVSD